MVSEKQVRKLIHLDCQLNALNPVLEAKKVMDMPSPENTPEHTRFTRCIEEIRNDIALRRAAIATAIDEHYREKRLALAMSMITESKDFTREQS